MERFEDRKILEYLIRILNSRKIPAAALSNLCDWFATYGEALELGRLNKDLSAFIEGCKDQYGRPTIYKANEVHSFKKNMLPFLLKREKKLARARASNLEKNLVALQSELGLSDCEKELLGVKARYVGSKKVEELVGSVKHPMLTEQMQYSIIIGTSLTDVSQVFDRKSRLVQTGIMGFDQDIFAKKVSLELHMQVFQALMNATGGLQGFREALLGAPAKASLTWDDYDYLESAKDKIASFLRAAKEKQECGINILLHGAPGTGKTEFAKTLANYLNMPLYLVCETDEDGDEPSRKERVGSLRINYSLLGEASNALLLFDEMEDLLDLSFLSLLSGSPQSLHKAFTHRLLENNPVPTIWTINNLKLLDEAIISRMDVVLGMKVPPVSAREKMWKRTLARHQVKVSEEEVLELARQEDLPARNIEHAVRFARLTQGATEDIRFVTSGLTMALHGREAIRELEVERNFHPDLFNADFDLVRLVAGLRKESACRRFSFCLYGRPGTGKSAWGRSLAQQLGMEVLHKRASELIDMYQGNSEKNIARMFQQAREEEKLLILDEADAMLFDRRMAHGKSDISQVAEMLTWMESHPLPFVCTTNLMEELDSASLRRFTFKIKFEYLSSSQSVIAFQFFFDQKVPARLGQVRFLTPGDFAVVAHKASVLGELTNPEALVDMLMQEVAARGDKALGLGFSV